MPKCSRRKGEERQMLDAGSLTQKIGDKMRRVMPLMKARSLIETPEKTVSRAPTVDGVRCVRRQPSSIRRLVSTEQAL
jgi:ABC-type uncharacterized transport system involved in gliding motility auxiliary subunit